MIEDIEIGATFKSNAGLVLQRKSRPHKPGEAEGLHGITLCFLQYNHDPFVVWRYIVPENGSLPQCIHGDYIHDLKDAIKRYDERNP